ncbi:spore germination protein [Paenibacillus chartarius]|uniref:Spore germination protein n=1 Tax=Paenibacillus chartarius TaxID=747481 RepID=A0ABV6DFU9_9BACL
MIDMIKQLLRSKTNHAFRITAEAQPPSAERCQDLAAEIETAIAQVTEVFGPASDVVVRRIEGEEGKLAALLFINSLVDKMTLDTHVAKPLISFLGAKSGLGTVPLEHIGNMLSTARVRVIVSREEAVQAMLEGNTLVLMNGAGEGLACETNGGQRRSVSEGERENVVRGSHEAFNEALETNIGLVRRRIRSPRLQVEQRAIGTVSNTPLAVLYIEGVAKPDIVEQVRERLGAIRIDGVLESLYIEELIEDRAYTPFPTVFSTERPDRIAACLLEGRVAIMLEGTPMALVVPATIGLFIYSNEDYYQRFDISSLLKLLRTTTFLLSFFLPGFYVSLLTFHQEMLPTPLLIALTGQREGVPLGAALEIALMELTFEILREAGIRLPKTVGTAISIVGGLVLGQAAVEAGLVAPGTVITVSLTAIASFTTPSYNIAISARMIRFFLLGCSAVLGAFGFYFGVILVFTHLQTLRSFGVPYMSPIVPFHRQGWKDTFLRFPWTKLKMRPKEVASPDNRRRLNLDPEGESGG